MSIRLLQENQNPPLPIATQARNERLKAIGYGILGVSLLVAIVPLSILITRLAIAILGALFLFVGVKLSLDATVFSGLGILFATAYVGFTFVNKKVFSIAAEHWQKSKSLLLK